MYHKHSVSVFFKADILSLVLFVWRHPRPAPIPPQPDFRSLNRNPGVLSGDTPSPIPPDAQLDSFEKINTLQRRTDVTKSTVRSQQFSLELLLMRLLKWRALRSGPPNPKGSKKVNPDGKSIAPHTVRKTMPAKMFLQKLDYGERRRRAGCCSQTGTKRLRSGTEGC